VGHRFSGRVTSQSAPTGAIIANSLRTARKNFTERVWKEWCERVRAKYGEDVWSEGWQRFARRRRSAEREREYLHAKRVRDEFWYARRFGLSWPVK
jgi:hypothetical protein